MSALGTATGLAFAARLPLQRILATSAGALGGAGSEPAALAMLTVPEHEALHRARADLAAHGLVRAQGRPIPGINAFSAPALDHDGVPTIVVTALGNQDGFPIDWNSPVADAVRAAVAKISRHLGWPGGAPPHDATGR